MQVSKQHATEDVGNVRKTLLIELIYGKKFPRRGGKLIPNSLSWWPPTTVPCQVKSQNLKGSTDSVVLQRHNSRFPASQINPRSRRVFGKELASILGGFTTTAQSATAGMPEGLCTGFMTEKP